MYKETDILVIDGVIATYDIGKLFIKKNSKVRYADDEEKKRFYQRPEKK